MGNTNTLPVRSKFTDKKENERIKYIASTCQGRNEKIEDAFAAILDLDDTNSTSFFGVYDGYGGAEVALYCAEQFHIELCNHEDYHNNLTNAVERVFFSLDEKLQKSDDFRELVTHRDNQWLHCLKAVVCAKLWTFPQATNTGPDYLGCTACVVVVRGNKIIVGNAGDSRCILSRNGQAIDLVPDHQPEIQSEIRTVLTVGGESEEQISIRNPDILTVDITEDVEFLVIASRGLRRSNMSNEEVVDFVRKRFLSEAVAQDLRAFFRIQISMGEVVDSETQGLHTVCEDLIEKGLPSGENTTVILVMFKVGDPAASASASARAAASASAAAATTEADNNIDDEDVTATFISVDDTTSDVFPSASDRAKADNNTGDEVDPTTSVNANDRAKADNNTSNGVDPTTSACNRAKDDDNNTINKVDPITSVRASDRAEDDNNTSDEVDAIFVSTNDMSSNVFPNTSVRDSDRVEADNNTGDEVDPTTNASIRHRAKADNNTNNEVDPTTNANANDGAEDDGNTGYEIDPTVSTNDKAKDDDNNTSDMVDLATSARDNDRAENDNNTGEEVDATLVSVDDMSYVVFPSTSASDRADADNNTDDEVDPSTNASDRAEDDDNTVYEVDSTTGVSDRTKDNNNTDDEVEHLSLPLSEPMTQLLTYS
ncbi:hypothetical protein GUJ93_ZPchr0006g43576 [Zizania palustris]|uniref:PPM-type phosphatase domain-containing protein n=1 Tax=Zizania palustris TaxID=103762 RepID=A0A8J5S915_ZIZPA|nr:hypothetical protein GUJ93_ZPchr0006g43576 [Zizania palustris]